MIASEKKAIRQRMIAQRDAIEFPRELRGWVPVVRRAGPAKHGCGGGEGVVQQDLDLSINAERGWNLVVVAKSGPKAAIHVE